MNERIGQISTAADAAAMFRAALPKEQKEERVFVLPLDGSGKAIAKPILVSVGHQDGTFACREAIRLAERAKRVSREAVARARAAIDAGTIFREALKADAEEIIVAHNHPSGDLTPSKADITATKELKDLAARLAVVFIDHIILGGSDSDYASLEELGLL